MIRMEGKEFTEEASTSAASLGWPFGLATCKDIQTPEPTESAALPLHQQFFNLQSTFLLPIFSDADIGSPTTSDSDSRSEAASSFFKDSRRITLGSLIGVPLDTSFRLDALQTRRSFLPSCGILELLGCVRHPDYASEDNGEDYTVITASSRSLAGSVADRSDQARSSTVFEDALSTGSRSPDWNDQFVSCHSILFDGESISLTDGVSRELIATPMHSTSRQNSHKPIQRSSSLKSFFSSICCRVDTQKHVHSSSE